MNRKVVLKSAKPQPAATPPATQGTKRPGTMPGISPIPVRKKKQEGSNAGVIAAVVCGVILLIIVAVAAGNKPSPQRTAASSPRSSRSQPEPYQPKRFSELGGKTMAEYMAENNKDNKMLQERQARVRGHEGGKR
jgi:hypothetical protein